MKIYILADQEGVACVFSRRERSANAAEYATVELAAVCEVLLANGVDEIVLNTPHAIEYDRLPGAVRIIHGLPRGDLWTAEMNASFSYAMAIGTHAMAGGREKGCWRHTVLPHPISQAYSSVEGVWLNDVLVGEIGLFAGFAGIHGVPLVFVTGDHWACLEAEERIPGVATVAVKKGLSYFSASSMTPRAAAEASAAGAVHALAGADRAKPWTVDGAATLRVRYLFPERATDAVTAVRRAERIDERTVAVTYPSMADLRDNLGNLRAPEMEVFARDSGLGQTTGLLTRLGTEPYLRKATYPLG